MSTATKDTIYVDIDDEITSIIDKVQASKHKIVALVLPKRAVTLQSIVNMRLLKRTGQELDKRIVLITSEASLLPLAGIVGLYTAKTLQSKPVIPPTPDTSSLAEAMVDDTAPEPTEDEEPLDNDKSIGELAGMPKEPPEHNSIGAMAVEETIDVDNTVEEGSVAAKKAGKKAKKIKIPNFESFRLRLFLGVLLFIILIVGWVMAATILPKARVTIKTDNTSVTSNISFTIHTDAKTVDTAQSIIPGQSKDIKKTDNLKITATGQKNVGEKAAGSMTVYNCTDNDITLPAGTAFTNSGFSFTTNVAATIPHSTFSSPGSGSVCLKNFSASVAVTAAQSGGSSNLNGGRTYLSNYSSTVTGTGSAMTGGTDKNVTVVSQQDVDTAKGQLVDKSKDAAVKDLAKLLTEAKLIVLTDTLTNADPVATSSPKVGDESGDVTVTLATTYTMLGIKAEDIEKLIALDAKKQIDLAKQPITDYGLDKAAFHFVSKRSSVDISLSVQTVAIAGTKIDPAALKKEIVGKKKGDVVDIIEKHPGVKDVTVSYSPFWVNKIPSKPAKTTIVFEQTNSNGK